MVNPQDNAEFADACPDGTRIGELVLHEAFARGGEGLVYHATWRGRRVLAKEYRPSNLSSRVMSLGQAEVRASRQSWQDQYRQALERYIYLGERLRGLPPHQNIVRVHDIVRGMGTAFLVMDEVQGPSLGALLDNVGVCNPAQAFHLADQLSQTLLFLEREKLVHRDIAPDNIIVSDANQWSIVLIDFNAAKDMSARVSHSFVGLVKPGYSPIEQYDTASDNPGVEIDIYSTAAVLYRAITGKPPLDAGRRMYRDEHRTLSVLNLAGYDPAFLTAIDHGLDVRPENRPQSAASWREELGLVYRRTGAAAPGEVSDAKPASTKGGGRYQSHIQIVESRALQSGMAKINTNGAIPTRWCASAA